MEFTLRRIRLPNMRRFGEGVRLGFSAPRLKNFEALMKMATDRSKKETAEWIAKEILKKSQRNIKRMNAIDQSILLDSGYAQSLNEERGSWVVGYRAPYAWYVDRGTRNYRWMPPFEKIYAWVKRNIYIATKTTTEPKQVRRRNTPQRNDSVNIRVTQDLTYERREKYRVTTAGMGGKRQRDYRYPSQVEYKYRKVKRTVFDGKRIRTRIKPQKGEFELAREEGGKLARYDYEKFKDEKEIIRVTNRIRWHIYKHGTEPKPFWSEAVAEVSALSEDAFKTRFKRQVESFLMPMMRRSIRNAARIFGGHLRTFRPG